MQSNAENGALRLDRWLWFARFCKSRTLATHLCRSGRIRVNRAPTEKPDQQVRPGDVLTFPQGLRVRVVRVLELGVRRGPPPEARKLYEDLSPPAALPRRMEHERPRGTGRPTKRERRSLDRVRRKR